MKATRPLSLLSLARAGFAGFTGCGASTLGVLEMLPVFEIYAAVYNFARQHCWQKGRPAANDSTASSSGSSESFSSCSAGADEVS